MDITLSIRITDTDWKENSPRVEREIRFEFPDDCDMLARMNFGAIADDALKAAVEQYRIEKPLSAVEAEAQS